MPHTTGITSIHEPDKYVAAGLLYILPGQSIDNDGPWDLETLCKRFPNVKVEELTFTGADGSVKTFKNGK